MKRFATSAVLLLVMVVGISQPLNLSKLSLNTIVIDPGHGGKDPGCLSHDHSSYEKDLCLKIALKVGKDLKDSLPNVRIIYTRKTDVFVPLWQRAAIANTNNADLFISVHCNAHTDQKFKGIETYVMGLKMNAGNLAVTKRENGTIRMETDYKENTEYAGFDPDSEEGHIIMSLYQNAYRNQSLQLASTVQEKVNKKNQQKSLGVKEAGFLVLWKTAMPSILVESGFMTNPEEFDFLKTNAGQTAVSNTIVESVLDYKRKLGQ
ncbi:MAG: N-acetylmuramoyl-L-alanine amidase [Bacteroidia bacterium]|jgi:N-acetylmuramoyl-L-alanine amidase